jgi:hypothetical protein
MATAGAPSEDGGVGALGAVRLFSPSYVHSVALASVAFLDDDPTSMVDVLRGREARNAGVGSPSAPTSASAESSVAVWSVPLGFTPAASWRAQSRKMGHRAKSSDRQ